MAGSTFGNIFSITTWGESHGKGIGVVIDGCPGRTFSHRRRYSGLLKPQKTGTIPFHHSP